MSNSAALPTDLDELQARTAAAEQFEYLFWGHQVPEDGTFTKSCLSQWYPASFTAYGLPPFSTAEHWMMAEKARLFDDDDLYREILAAPTPKKAKALGRKVKDFNVAVWAANCRDIVTRGNLEKFKQNPPLLEFLLGTTGKVLVEASPYDKIWGIGMRESDKRATDPAQWQGSNLLWSAPIWVTVVEK